MGDVLKVTADLDIKCPTCGNAPTSGDFDAAVRSGASSAKCQNCGRVNRVNYWVRVTALR